VRDNPVFPEAVIRRYTDEHGTNQFLIRPDLDPAERRLMAAFESLERPDDLVRYDNNVPHRHWGGAPNSHPGG